MAIGLGYHHLDGAEVYKTETELGTAIKNSGVAREKLYVVTKVLPNIEDIPSALETSLKKLGVSYVDLYGPLPTPSSLPQNQLTPRPPDKSYLIHAPFFSDNKATHQAKWAQMESLQASGLARSIGVSNYLPEQLAWLLETARVPPAINQIEFHPYLQHKELLRYHREHVRFALPSSPKKKKKSQGIWLTRAEHRDLRVRAPDARDESVAGPRGRGPRRAGEEVRRQSRRGVSAVVRGAGRRGGHDEREGAEAERLLAGDDV